MRTPEKKRNGKWQVRFEDAHRRIRYKTFATKAEANRALIEIERQKSQGIDPARRVRFDELVDEWTESHLASGLRASAVKDYKQSLKRMTEEFGQRDVRSISSADLERLRNGLVESIRRRQADAFERTLAKRPELAERAEEIRAQIARGGVRAAAKVVGCARTLWKFAVSRGYVARNIAADVKKPKAERTVETDVIDQNILNPTEIGMLLTAAHEHRLVIQFLFMTGVRIGELQGLHWTDIDWPSSRVIVRRQLSGVDGELTAPKTRAGTRWIDLPRDLLPDLKTHRLRTPGEFVFPIDARNFRTRVWHPALRRAGLRAIRIHDARHTHASLLIASGADVVAVSRRLGHADPAITLKTYSHAFERRDAAPLGEHLAAFMRRETVGCDLVVPSTSAEVPHAEVVEKMVARVGIEPTTRGFSVRCSTN